MPFGAVANAMDNSRDVPSSNPSKKTDHFYLIVYALKLRATIFGIKCVISCGTIQPLKCGTLLPSITLLVDAVINLIQWRNKWAKWDLHSVCGREAVNFFIYLFLRQQ